MAVKPSFTRLKLEGILVSSTRPLGVENLEEHRSLGYVLEFEGEFTFLGWHRFTLYCKRGV